MIDNFFAISLWQLGWNFSRQHFIIYPLMAPGFLMAIQILLVLLESVVRITIHVVVWRPILFKVHISFQFPYRHLGLTSNKCLFLTFLLHFKHLWIFPFFISSFAMHLIYSATFYVFGTWKWTPVITHSTIFT